jgi:hypothetical protein
MVPGSSQDQLYQYALSAKHWKAGNLRLELLCEEGVDVAFGEKLTESQSISHDKGTKKYNIKKRNGELFNEVECYEVYCTEVSLNDLDFS